MVEEYQMLKDLNEIKEDIYMALFGNGNRSNFTFFDESIDDFVINEFDAGANATEDNDDEDSSFEGALVGDPTLINDFGVAIYGDPTNYLFVYSIDMDMKAFYPNTIHVLNIDVSTLIYKCILDASQYDVRGGKIPYRGITDIQLNKNNSDSFQGDIANEVFDNFQTKNY